MPNLTTIITSPDPAIRNQSLDAFCRKASLDELMQECAALDAFRRELIDAHDRCATDGVEYALVDHGLSFAGGAHTARRIPSIVRLHDRRRNDVVLFRHAGASGQEPDRMPERHQSPLMYFGPLPAVFS